MAMRNLYSEHVKKNNVEGSKKAPSYIRALDLLGPILAKHSVQFSQYLDLWSVQSVTLIDRLYEYILEQQNLGDMGIFDTAYKPSYWRSQFYSAALKNYKEFLILSQYKDDLWQLYNVPKVEPSELGERMAKKKVEAIEGLVSERDIDFSSREGKDLLRATKARINQDFFRDMILRDYGEKCCVTGLNVPEVLRASHIVGWAVDKKNRLNPANGLCLSATYDAAFDRHLISFDDEYRMLLSPALKEYFSNEAVQQHFVAFEGTKMTLPKRFLPDQRFLALHREKLAS